MNRIRIIWSGAAAIVCAALLATGQETNQTTTAQQRAAQMELVRSNMLRQAEIQRARAATNVVALSNANSFVVAQPVYQEPSLHGLWLNTNEIATDEHAYRFLLRVHQQAGEKLAKRMEGAPPDVISNAVYQETNFVLRVIEHIHASAQTNQTNPTNN